MYRMLPTDRITARPEGLRATDPDATGEPVGSGFFCSSGTVSPTNSSIPMSSGQMKYDLSQIRT